jgi:hypothetical protein
MSLLKGNNNIVNKSIQNISEFKTPSRKTSKTIYSNISSNIISKKYKTYIVTPKPNPNYPSYENEFRIFLSSEITEFHDIVKHEIEVFAGVVRNKLNDEKINSHEKKKFTEINSMWEDKAYPPLEYNEPLKKLLCDYDNTYNLKYGQYIALGHFGLSLYEYVGDVEIHINNSLELEIEKVSENEDAVIKYLNSNKCHPSYLEDYFNYKKEFTNKKSKVEEEKMFTKFYLCKLQRDNDREIVVKIKPSAIKLSSHNEDGSIIHKSSINYTAYSITVQSTHKKHNQDDDEFESNFIDKIKNTPPIDIIEKVNEVLDKISKDRLIDILNGIIDEANEVNLESH